MSDQEDYTASYDAFMAIADSDVKTPDMPVDANLQESENLFQFCQPDKLLLLAAGLPEILIDAIPVRAGALRIAEARWYSERNSNPPARVEWEVESTKAYELRDDLLDAFRYAFRDDPKLLEKVAGIAEGGSQADLVQDLKDIAVLGEKHSPLLEKINLDLNLLNTSASLSDSLAVLLARMNGEKSLESEVKNIRDRAYTYLKEATDEVKSCGRYVFRKKPARLKGYQNIYKNKHKKKKDSAEADES